MATGAYVERVLCKPLSPDKWDIEVYDLLNGTFSEFLQKVEQLFLDIKAMSHSPHEATMKWEPGNLSCIITISYTDENGEY